MLIHKNIVNPNQYLQVLTDELHSDIKPEHIKYLEDFLICALDGLDHIDEKS
jgi:hypothetical protein